ncbi:MAG: hypothetical protein GKR94_06050 [Gammaproteobacteria bacterium]|nr:hypothetical protein [Gammaproteobacteria bacterium]
MAAIDYCLSLNSPWIFLGQARLSAMAAKAGSTVRMHLVRIEFKPFALDKPKIEYGENDEKDDCNNSCC